MLLRKGKITEEVAKLILSWRHFGFNVHCGSRIQSEDEEAMENIARSIIRASFSQERMSCIPEESGVLYRSKDGKNEKTFDAPEWLAAMCSHVPNKGKQMVRYCALCRPGKPCGARCLSLNQHAALREIRALSRSKRRVSAEIRLPAGTVGS
jgi:hypothetical protein